MKTYNVWEFWDVDNLHRVTTEEPYFTLDTSDPKTALAVHIEQTPFRVQELRQGREQRYACHPDDESEPVRTFRAKGGCIATATGDRFVVTITEDQR